MTNPNMVAGGKKSMKRNQELYGKDFPKNIGRLGGSVKGTKKGFAAISPEQRRELGRKGGIKSRKGAK